MIDLSFLFSLILLWSNSSTPQTPSIVKIEGTVRDAQTHEAIPFVNLVFKAADASILSGTTTDLNGHYAHHLYGEEIKETIEVELSFTGYLKNQSFPLTLDSSYVEMDFSLQQDNVELEPVIYIITNSFGLNGCETRTIMLNEEGDTIKAAH